MTYYNYETYSDYEEEYGDLGRGGFQKTSKAKKMKKEDKPKKNKHVRNLSSEDIWTMMEVNSEENSGSKKGDREVYTTLADVSKSKPAERKDKFSQTSQNQGEKKFVPGPNTQTIRNYQIDFDRVFDITKTEGEYNGRKNFGVKFEFKGTKGLFRIIWFHSQTDRDSLYNEKYTFWTSLATCPLNKRKENTKNGRY